MLRVAIVCLALAVASFSTRVSAQAVTPYVGPDELAIRSEGETVYVFRGMPDGPFLPLAFVPEEADRSLFVLREQGRRREPVLLCEAACPLALEAGELWLAVGRADGHAERTSQPLAIAPDLAAASLHGRYEDRSDLRTAGWLVLVGGVLGGIALAVTGSLMGLSTDPNVSRWGLAVILGGNAVVATSAVLGIYLAGLRDLGHVELR